MRSFSTILAATSVFAATVFGASNVAARNHGRDKSCMSDADAQQVATNFGHLLDNYSDTLANESLTVDYTDYSDSVIELINSGCTGPVAVSGDCRKSRNLNIANYLTARLCHLQLPCVLRGRPRRSTKHVSSAIRICTNAGGLTPS